jgi:toxin FitB
MIILDTNVISALMALAPEKAVMDWIAEHHEASIYTTAITQAEIMTGIELLAVGKKKKLLTSACEHVFAEDFKNRILDFDSSAAQEFSVIYAARKKAGQNMGIADAQIAAIASAHNATLATRNTKDFKHCGIKLINPWKA